MPRPSQPPELVSAPEGASVTLVNRQRRVAVPMPWLQQFAALALGPCLATPGKDVPVEGAGEYEISLVSDRTIAKVHLDFMGLPDPTDIITFQHGELIISAETAAAKAAELGHSVPAEIGLYIVHGLLHLNGFDDMSAPAAARMRRQQERIWQACLARLPEPPAR